MEHKIFTPEQKQRAKNADLIEFLKAYMGFDFKKAGHYYQCVQHNSLVVYPDRKGFVWNSRNISGGDTIDFVRKVEGKSYPEAIEAIIGEKAAAVCQSAPTYKSQAGKLVLPQKAEGKYSRVFAYLAETRGIAPSVIADFMKSKQLYQDTRGNCVFVGYDENGTAKFGSIRTTLTDKKYRPDCKYSDKRYAFSQIGTDTTKVYVFEAPIDLLSHCTMTNQAFNAEDAYKGQTRLALCGTSDVALKAFLERHPEVTTINLRLDNDEAGRMAVSEYKAKYQALGYTVNAVFSKNKDVNEDLVKKEQRQGQKKPPKR